MVLILYYLITRTLLQRVYIYTARYIHALDDVGRYSYQVFAAGKSQKYIIGALFLFYTSVVIKCLDYVCLIFCANFFCQTSAWFLKILAMGKMKIYQLCLFENMFLLIPMKLEFITRLFKFIQFTVRLARKSVNIFALAIF